jgi:hypothetical protein
VISIACPVPALVKEQSDMFPGSFVITAGELNGDIIVLPSSEPPFNVILQLLIVALFD